VLPEIDRITVIIILPFLYILSNRKWEWIRAFAGI